MSNLFFFLMIRRPPRSTLDRSSAASDVYKRQVFDDSKGVDGFVSVEVSPLLANDTVETIVQANESVSYTHLRAHETVLDLVCRLLLEKKKYKNIALEPDQVRAEQYFSFIDNSTM